MSVRRDRWLGPMIALALAGCSTAPPLPPLVSGASGGDLIRIERVGDALVTGNAELCTGSIGTLMRPGTGKSATPHKQCNINFRLVALDGVGAAADGNEILISAGMLRFVRNDDELAAVMAHRMAHLLAERAPRQPLLTQIGDWVDLGPGDPEPVYDPAREHAADRISVFLLARAGIDPAAAARFWRRMASLPSGATDWTIRHPVSAARIDYLDGVATEIGMLRGANQPLRP